MAGFLFGSVCPMQRMSCCKVNFVYEIRVFVMLAVLAASSVFVSGGNYLSEVCVCSNSQGWHSVSSHLS